MLTKDDLLQIRKVIREEVGNETKALKNELQADITMARMKIQSNIDELTDRVKNIEIRLTKVEEGLSNLRKTVAKMHKDLRNEIKLVSHVLDKENIKTLKRVEIIERHLNIN